LLKDCKNSKQSGVYLGRGFGGQTPFWKNFFHLLGFFEKKIPKPPRRYKKISKPLPQKISGYTPVNNCNFLR